MLLSLNYHTVRSKRPLILGICFVLLLASALLALLTGAYPISLSEVVNIILSKFGLNLIEVPDEKMAVLWTIRLPRVLLAILVGGALAVAGASLQGLFRNPLVEPAIIGVSSGSALFAVIMIVFSGTIGWQLQSIMGVFALPFAAFIGGLLNTFLAYRLASKGGKTDISILILAGVAINALSAALISLVIYYGDDNAIRNFTFWSLGSLGGASWTKLYIAGTLVLLSSVIIMSFPRSLNALAIGESEAFHMGVNVQKVKYVVLFFSALAVGAGVSVTGAIGFVGLVVPHLVRMVLGSDHHTLLPVSFLTGGILLLVSDVLSRIIVAPAELSIGIITAILGAPFFIYILMNFKQKRITV
ncbi:iron ABC transporter permease [Echinicola sp. CAU 1574]|uniref:Iron ABC transporter permease n=1 Tax=Echinicola arenosa TaxID=2774144 RepID=A0ABR9APH8_9BACT|nr:iron ABC transporter permease [Echinicola arenosa]MBD8490615.1 iron ABC transporter permease [Echinicola arenosa]